MKNRGLYSEITSKTDLDMNWKKKVATIKGINFTHSKMIKIVNFKYKSKE